MAQDTVGIDDHMPLDIDYPNECYDWDMANRKAEQYAISEEGQLFKWFYQHFQKINGMNYLPKHLKQMLIDDLEDRHHMRVDALGK